VCDLLLYVCVCRVDYILAHPDVLSVTAFKMGVRVTPHGVSDRHNVTGQFVCCNSPVLTHSALNPNATAF